MTLFRPCIDLHQGQVKQIIGGTLSDSGNQLRTNFVSQLPSQWYADLYKQDNLEGGHLIMLGPDNEDAAFRALQAWPGGLQIGGGITVENAKQWLEAGASKVIITSWIFEDGAIQWNRVRELQAQIGVCNLVLDLSCRRHQRGWAVATHRWQQTTDFNITPENLEALAKYCSEFLIHAADVEGKQQGMDEELITLLGKYSPIPTTYAGGARSLGDLERIEQLSHGRLDLTIGSAMDIFGGSGVRYKECVAFNKARKLLHQGQVQ